MNSFEIKKDRLPVYLLANLFLINLLAIFGIIILQKNIISTPLIRTIFIQTFVILRSTEILIKSNFRPEMYVAYIFKGA